MNITKEKYLRLCEQMREEPKEDKCPPDFEDFPPVVQDAVVVFNKLGDRVVADVGYIGKDYTLLPILLETLYIPNKELFLEVLTRLDADLIKRSNEQMKRAREAAKKK